MVWAVLRLVATVKIDYQVMHEVQRLLYE